MNIFQWQIILMVLIIVSVCYVNCDKDNKGGKNTGNSKNNKNKCKNGNNGRGKGKGREKGSGEDNCNDDSTVNVPVVPPTKFSNPDELVEITEASENDQPLTEPDLIVIESELVIAEFEQTVTESNDVKSSSTSSETEPETELIDYEENANNANEEDDSSHSVTDATSVPTTQNTPIISKITTMKPSRRPTRGPADCINCRHPSTTPSKPTSGGNITEERRHNTRKKPNKYYQDCFANGHNYWFGIHVSNRINMFYNRPVNYFRAGPNYWYGLFLPNLRDVLPKGCSVCNQKPATRTQKFITILNGKHQEKIRVSY